MNANLNMKLTEAISANLWTKANEGFTIVIITREAPAVEE
jgi:hypothetical protein